MSASRIYSIAPHAPFLDTLAAKVLDGTLVPGWDLSQPFALADVTIILPTRRARLALADAFARLSGGAALLPDIRTLGGVPEEEEPFLPPFDTPLPGKPISSLDRKLVLAQLVEQFVKSSKAAGFDGFTNPPSAGEILSLAGALGELIDDCHIEQVTPADLHNITPDNLAENWKAVLEFLNIALEAWPLHLQEQGLIDAAALRNDNLRRQTDAAALIFGDRPVIAAGSTGSIPATGALLKAVHDLPRGALVLPGLNTQMSPETFARLNTGSHSHGHAQYGLAQLLQRLGARPESVIELAPEPHPRTALVREALALAEDTTGWSEARQAMSGAIPAALEDVSIAVARTDEEQARAIAIAAQDALTKDQSVGIVSPDRNLARRVTAELKRFDIHVDDSAGVPLFQSRSGRMARQIVALVRNRFAPVDLMALLRAQPVRLGLPRADIAKAAGLMEFAMLRGQRPAPGINGLLALMDANLEGKLPYVPRRLTPEDANLIKSVLIALEEAVQPLSALFDRQSFEASELARTLGTVFERLVRSPDAPVRSNIADTRAFEDWLRAMALTQSTGPLLNAHSIEHSLLELMSGVSVRTPDTSTAAISIWGHLEARLQNPDLIILAGMSEGTWPEPADPGPWMSRGMRLAAGLEPPEKRQGQAAHDFEMAMGNKKVLITRAERSGTSPAVPSRLLQRLAAFAGDAALIAAEKRGAIWVERARDLDYAGEPQPAVRPQPKPPVSKRPKSLSVTEVETLVRSPYDLYAKYVLGLRRNDPLGDDPDARERGTLIHDILGRFIEEGHDVMAPDAFDTLMVLAEEVYTALEALPERRTLWLERFAEIARGFLAYERDRHAKVSARNAELYGKWNFPIAGEAFTLRGRADRIDLLADNTLEIIDFKTGSIPDPGEMKDYSAPQLLLEAAMAREGVFTEIPPVSSSALTYIKVGHGPDAFALTDFRLNEQMGFDDAVDEVVRRLQMQAQAYLFTEDLPMTARIYPNPKQRFAGDYDHLARTGEWSAIEGEDDAS